MAGIVAADSVSHALQVQQWDGEVRQESKHAADLKQLDNGVKIPPRWDMASLHDYLIFEQKRNYFHAIRRYLQ